MKEQLFLSNRDYLTPKSASITPLLCSKYVTPVVAKHAGEESPDISVYLQMEWNSAYVTSVIPKKHHLGTYEKCRFSGLSLDLLNQKL